MRGGPIRISMKLRLFAALAASLAVAQSPRGSEKVTFEGQPALLVSNDKLQLTVFPHGTGLGNLVLSDDPQKLNPLWNPIRLAREAGRDAPFNGTFGHFPCVDGFGQPSPEDRAAGIPQHGEAHVTDFNVVEDSPGTVTLSARLPIVQEVFTRTFHIVPGENVIYVDSQLENLLGFDRPVNWGEHATVDAPFLEPGKVRITLSGTRSQNRDYTQGQGGRGGNAAPGGRAGNAGPAGGRGNAPATQRRLVPGADFTWPMAPGLDGKPVDMSILPEDPHYIDHAATLFDPSKRLAWLAVFNTEKHLVYGYVIRREDYPWVQHWGNYPSVAGLVRGLEFATQPYDVPKRETVTMGSMFGTPTYRWLPAKSKIDSHFLLFYSRTPAGLNSVDDVRLDGGKLTIEDQTTKKQLVLAA